MPDARFVDLPWLFPSGFFPQGPERNPTPDIPVLAAGRWNYRPFPRLPFRFATNDGPELAHLRVRIGG